jgi:hypothetical protein
MKFLRAMVEKQRQREGIRNTSSRRGNRKQNERSRVRRSAQNTKLLLEMKMSGRSLGADQTRT